MLYLYRFSQLINKSCSIKCSHLPINAPKMKEITLMALPQQDLKLYWEEDLTLKLKLEDKNDHYAIIQELEDAEISYFSLRASFAQLQDLQQYVLEWKLLTCSFQPRQQFRVPRRITHSQECGLQLMFLGNDQNRGHIFMEIYQRDIADLEAQYDIRMETNGRQCAIYSELKRPLNMICKNTLMDMNNQLSVHYSLDPTINQIFSSSTKLQRQLQKEGIYFKNRKLRGKSAYLFYSIIQNNREMRLKIESIALFHIIILDISHKSINKVEQATIKQLIKQSLKKQINSIEGEHEIQIEFSQQNSFIIIHCQHITFGKQPLLLLKRMLANLIIFSVKSSKISIFDHKIRKLMHKYSFVEQKTNISRNQTFIAVKLDQIEAMTNNGKIGRVQLFVDIFRIIVEQNLQIKIFYNYFCSEWAATYFQRVLSLAEESHFILSTNNFVYEETRKAIFKFKDYSQHVYLKKEKEVIMFIRSIITSKQPKIHKILLFSGKENANDQNLPLPQLGQISQLKISWLISQQQLPKFVNFKQKDKYFKNNRNIDVQRQLNIQSSFQFKVWNLQQIPSQINFSSPYILLRKRGNESNHFEYCKIGESELGEQSMMAVKIDDNSDLLQPLYFIRRIV